MVHCVLAHTHTLTKYDSIFLLVKPCPFKHWSEANFHISRITSANPYSYTCTIMSLRFLSLITIHFNIWTMGPHWGWYFSHLCFIHFHYLKLNDYYSNGQKVWNETNFTLNHLSSHFLTMNILKASRIQVYFFFVLLLLLLPQHYNWSKMKQGGMKLV